MFKLIDRDKDGGFKLEVKSIIKYSYNSYKITLKFPDPEWKTGLWPGGHFVMVQTIEGEPVARKYTPVSPLN